MNATQLAGLFAFGLAALAALAARPRAWRGLAAVHAWLSIDVLTNLRYSLYGLRNHLSPDEYAARRPYQAAAIVAVVLFAIIVLVFIRRTAASSPQHQWARSLTLLVLALFVVEIISLHAVDAVMYAQVLGIKLVGWGWLGAGCGVALCAWGTRLDKR